MYNKHLLPDKYETGPIFNKQTRSTFRNIEQTERTAQPWADEENEKLLFVKDGITQSYSGQWIRNENDHAATK